MYFRVCVLRNEDLEMFDTLGLRSRPAFMPYASGNDSSRQFDSQPDAAVGRPAAAAPVQEVTEGGGCCGGKTTTKTGGGGCCS